jgi:multidrug efflux pump subunit AcrA (membrane-fusion protein)
MYCRYLTNLPKTFVRPLRAKAPIAAASLVAVVLPLLAFTLNGCAKSEAGGGSMAFPPASVRVGQAKSALITDASVFTGSVVSRESVALMPQIDGHITKIFVQAGEDVKKGQTVLEISPEHQQASVRSVVAAQDSAEEDLGNARHTLKALEATRASKVSALKLAEANYDRYSKLRANGAVSQEEQDTRENTLEQCKSELVTIDAQIHAQESSVRRMEKNLKMSGANVEVQKSQLDYYTIKAPFAGTIGDVPVKIGDYVNAQTRLTTVTQNKPLEIYVQVPVEKSTQVKKNMPIELLDSENKKIGISTVFFIAPSVATDSQTILVKSRFGNEKDQLRADQQVRARVIWETKQGVLIPTEAVSHQSGQDFVFLEGSKGGKPVAQQLPVQLGAIEGSEYQVLQGLKPGQKIIVSGIQNLSDGAPINPAM